MSNVSKWANSPFCEIHKNYDRTIELFGRNLAQNNLSKARSILNAVRYDAEQKMAAGNIEAANIADTLAEQLLMIDAQYRRVAEIKREKRGIVLALKNLVTCYATDGRDGYRGCGGAGLTIDEDGEQHTCKLCAGTGTIERQRDARDILERTLEKYDTVPVALQSLDDELAANPFKR